MKKKYIFIDPDGSQNDYLYAAVEENTGIVYIHQAGGYLNVENKIQGFLIPLNGINEAKYLQKFFARFKEYPPDSTKGEAWGKRDLEELSFLVREISIWYTSVKSKEDYRLFLKVDESRIQELTEG